MEVAMGHYACDMRPEWFEKNPRISRLDENWEALPQRLRGRGNWLLERGRIKDAELMFDAATEIAALRQRIDNTR
jgi:hypothetical protein